MNISYRAHFVFPSTLDPRLQLSRGVKLTPSLFTSNKIYRPLIPRAGLCVRSSSGLFVVLEWIIKLACCLCVPISPSMTNWRRQRRATGSSRRSISTSQPASRWCPGARGCRVSSLAQSVGWYSTSVLRHLLVPHHVRPGGAAQCLRPRGQQAEDADQGYRWKHRDGETLKTFCLIKYSY